MNKIKLFYYFGFWLGFVCCVATGTVQADADPVMNALDQVSQAKDDYYKALKKKGAAVTLEDRDKIKSEILDPAYSKLDQATEKQLERTYQKYGIEVAKPGELERELAEVEEIEKVEPFSDEKEASPTSGPSSASIDSDASGKKEKISPSKGSSKKRKTSKGTDQLDQVDLDSGDVPSEIEFSGKPATE